MRPKVDSAIRKIETLLREVKIIATEADEIIIEESARHAADHPQVDILDYQAVLAERASHSEVLYSYALRSSASQLETILKSEIRRLRNYPF